MLSHRISFSWHTCSIDSRIHVLGEKGENRSVGHSIQHTVHEHTQKPVENISIVSSEALLSVKLCVYGIANIRSIWWMRDEMRWSPDVSREGLVVIGPCRLRQQSFGTDTRPTTERCVRTSNSTTLKIRVLFKSTCIQARRMETEALWWILKSKPSRQGWASMFSSLFFLVCWINRHSERDYRGYGDYKSVIQVNKTLLWNAFMFSWWNARWICISICSERGLHLLET